jgi:acetyl/propionyl-CoA carboxylase alpha subunit
VSKLVIANRGEIARRILRTAHARGDVVAVISTAEDADALVRSEADAVLEVSSFLDAEAIVAAAKAWDADLLHPGYGFLSENAQFARKTEKAGIAFVGPTPESMERLGNKQSAKQLAHAADVATLPSVRSDELDELAGQGIEPPYLVKAAGGGGGRGMRIVQSRAELPAALERASEEANAGFGDPSVFIERYLAEPRHIELQVFGDGKGGGVVLGERECSLQRRYQKVIEEAPSPVVDGSLRSELSAAALKLVKTTAYRGAGTVEFLLDGDGRFYFLEVNTRLQVEHPVTELVYGVDLVAAQLELAEGVWPVRLETLEPTRWAIEARVLAEDPRAEFLPTPGAVRRYREPGGTGVRVDSGVAEGGVVNAQFDSMIAKVISVGVTRDEAIETLGRALESMVVHGPVTNLPFLQSVIRHPDFLAGSISTAWIGAHLDELNRSLLPEVVEERLRSAGFVERLSSSLRGSVSETRAAARFRSVGNDVARVGSVRERAAMSVELDSASGDVVLSGSDLPHPIQGVATAVDATSIALTVQGETLLLADPRALSHRRVRLVASDGEVRAPMAGKVLELRTQLDAAVEEGEVLAVVESMKMQLEIHAPLSGRVTSLFVEEGQILDGPDLIAVVAS